MLSKAVRLGNLLLAGMLAGNELGTWAAVHPGLEELSPPERLRAEQALTRRFGAVMPAWMGAALGSSFAAMLASTRLGNVPINARTLELTEDDIEEFERSRHRWGRLHTLRVALTTAGSAALVSGALAGGGR